MRFTTALILAAALGAPVSHALAQQPFDGQAEPGRETPAGAASTVPGAGNPAHGQFERILRAQVLLERQYLSPGEIDGAYGANMRQALTTYQARRGLPVTGKLDEATWSELNTDPSPTLVEYTISAQDVAGPFRPVPASMMAKAKLRALGYASALEGLGEKFHASPALLRRLNPGKSFTRAGETITVPYVRDKQPLPPAARVVVRDSTKTLQLHDAGGELLAQYPVSTGGKRDPLPIGNWKINSVHPNPVYNYNPKLFWDAAPGDSITPINPGPNNPVGVMWIDLSKPHYGIHGTPRPEHVGKAESHGCIRLTNWSATEVAALVSAGTDVEFIK